MPIQRILCPTDFSDKDYNSGASQSMLSRLDNDVLGHEAGLEALEAALTRSTDALLRRKNKRRLIIEVDSTADPAHGRQEGVAHNGHFAKLLLRD